MNSNNNAEIQKNNAENQKNNAEIKRNGASGKLFSPIHKLVTSQIINHFIYVISSFLLSFVLASAAKIESEAQSLDTVFAVSSLVGFLLCYFTSYSAAWHTGQRDYNLIKYSHIQLDNYKGLKAGLIAEIPGLVLALAAVVGFYAFGSGAVVSIFKGFYFHLWWLFLLNSSPLLFFFALVPVPVFSFWGYYNGVHLISLREKIVFMDPEEIEKRKSKDRRFR